MGKSKIQVIDYTCGQCRHEYRLKDELAGRSVECYKCNRTGIVGGGATSTPAFVQSLVTASSAPVKVPSQKPAGSMMQCPSCGYEQPKGLPECQKCQIIFSKLGATKTKTNSPGNELSMEDAEFLDLDDPGSGSLIGGLIGGTVAAAVGGTVWGFVAKATDFEFGFLAWGLGFLSGLGVTLLGGVGFLSQVVAVLSSVLGIAIGKYIYFSPESLDAFLGMLGSALSPYDLLWLFLAVATAWRIPDTRPSAD